MAIVSKTLITDKINGIEVNSSIKCSSSNYNNYSNREVKYIVIHYTGNIKDTARSNCTYFSNGSRASSAHIFVDNTTIYQSVELCDSAWHCGCSSGYKNDCRNKNSIGIEMCTSGNYIVSEQTQINAAYVCAYICKLIGITEHSVDKYVVRHYDVVASNKNCPAQFVSDMSQWIRFKTWVKNILNTGKYSFSSSITSTSSSNTSSVYRIRKSWSDSASQIGAYSLLENAISACKNGYYVFDNGGNIVYPVSSNSQSISKKDSTAFQVKLLDDLNIRQTPNGKILQKNGAKKGFIYTIVETSGAWGKLKSGAGWISVSDKYVKRV